ncbi:hypothetical protein NC652_018232 [Populus alba x Populus x berolinensis]|nr:hypothetical protein NC652_018232 [Populus alba x Populus x berolinensis]
MEGNRNFHLRKGLRSIRSLLHMPHHLEIHCFFSIINSCVTVCLLLTGFLATILHASPEETSFWSSMLMMRSQLKTKKRLGGSTSMVMYLEIRKYKSLLAASSGSVHPICLPTQFFIFVLALVGVFYPYNRGALFYCTVSHICSDSWDCRLHCSLFL